MSGSNKKPCSYSVPAESRRIFLEEILQNPLVKSLPPEVYDASAKIKFTGSNDPSISINWKFAESIASLKAFEGAMLSVLLQRKYGVEFPEIVIDTDRAQLFIMSAMTWVIDPEGEAIESSFHLARKGGSFFKHFPNWDIHQAQGSVYRSLCTNIYQTQDGRYFHLHGSMNPDATLTSIGLPLWYPDLDGNARDDIVQVYADQIKGINARDLEHQMSEIYRQAGTTCWTAEEYFASEHGKANSGVGLYEVHHHANSQQGPCWWPSTPSTNVRRPLAGLKVVDLTRVIAGPAITRGLAELGASVMRVVAPHVTDFSFVHCDLNWGKWNTLLDLRIPDDREKLKHLILDADVVVSGYRPGVLDKWGFAQHDILNLVQHRDRDIIYARENSYGWYGPWSHRPGWQQISDANCGVSMAFGRAMGLDEAVTPVFPNSDYCTGVCGTVGVIDALLQRVQNGGSYTVDLALNYYSQWLVRSVGVYPPDVWEKLWSANGRRVFRHHHSIADRIYRPDNFHVVHNQQMNLDFKIPKPVLQFPAGEVQLAYNIGTRTNGVDLPEWPEDLNTEVVG
ncbi:CoA-transferase family III [Aspergillus bertholletiae]|uniref:CoA-transferase family III n=1 Tax=Aspergillus bertholletiae TaxID=1226010 RepID=A0A5N7AUH4_9EURO|nr:CoA-transferase family III [Aspergillus bertholletiae]